MTTESLGISVPIPGKKTIFYRKEVLLGGFHAACSVARFRFRYRDLEFHSFGSETDSETPFSLKSVPSPIPRRDSDRESRCFGSETRESGISGTTDTSTTDSTSITNEMATSSDYLMDYFNGFFAVLLE